MATGCRFLLVCDEPDDCDEATCTLANLVTGLLSRLRGPGRGKDRCPGICGPDRCDQDHVMYPAIPADLPVAEPNQCRD